jgi:hypothetical protein
MKQPWKLLVLLTAFSIAMGFMESAVVVYIREIYYPGGFDFPIVTIDKTLAVTEILRESATILMLVVISFIAGRNSGEGFGWFLYCFAVWDIFYYVFLKAILGWPKSLITWDALFLIPLMWTGPVITPVITSLTMILMAMIIIVYSYRTGKNIQMGGTVWIFLITGAAVVFAAFIWDYGIFISEQVNRGTINNLSDIGIGNNLIYSYMPDKFNWWIFSAGEILILISIALLVRKLRRFNG